MLYFASELLHFNGKGQYQVAKNCVMLPLVIARHATKFYQFWYHVSLT